VTPRPDPGDRLLELYAEAARREHGTATAAAPAVEDAPAPRRVRAHALFIPHHLWPMVRNFAQARRIRLVLGAVDEATGRRTVYLNKEAAERILDAFSAPNGGRR